MKKLWGKIVFQVKRVPWYGWVAGVVMLLIEIAFYVAAKNIALVWSRAWWFQPKLNPVDNSIPFCGYVWIQVYMFAWLFWIFGPIVASVSKKDRFLNYMVSLITLYIVSFFFFIFAPTYMDRVDEKLLMPDGSLGPLIQNMNNGFSKLCLKYTFFFDGSRYNPNLMPCLHCSISLMCYLAINRNKDISLGSRIYAIILAVLIGMSTLFTKQHFFIDTVTGYLLAIIVWYVISLIKPGQKLVKKYPNIFVLKKKPNRNLQKKK